MRVVRDGTQEPQEHGDCVQGAMLRPRLQGEGVVGV
jgi:hypothetical protein